MIIGVFDGPYRPGEIVRGVYTRNIGEEYPAVFMIIRPATRDEWIAYRRDHNIDIIPGSERSDADFYEVTTD